jgi:hypothetical protein
MPLINLVGQRFDRLQVISYDGVLRSKPKWICRCDCGTMLSVRGDMLKCGNTRSCGCKKIDSATLHGHTHSGNKPPSKTYNSWQAMIARCTNPKTAHYDRYGGAGITICARWLQSFVNFLADMGERPEGHTLDRFPNKIGNYEPGNCRWATPQQQQCNMRTNRLLTIGDRTMSISEWADHIGIPRTVIQDRLRLNWTAKQAISMPYTSRERKKARSKINGK